jgi:hypothetical protein
MLVGLLAALLLAVSLLATLGATTASAQRCNVDAGCSNGVKPNYWLPQLSLAGKGKGIGYITYQGQSIYAQYDWWDFLTPGGGIDRYCGFSGEQIACPR